MKTKHWGLLLLGVFLLCAALSAYLLLPKQAAASVTVISDGTTVAVLELSKDTELTVPYGDGYNVITVRDGAVRVTEASCPDRYCVRSGARSAGLPIICLPNRLVLRFSEPGDLDGVTR